MLVKTKELKSSLEDAKKFIDTKSMLPILSNVMFDVKDDGFVVVATDLEDIYEKIMDCDADLTESFTVGNISGILKAMKFFGDELNIAIQDKDHVEFSSGNKKVQLTTLPVSEFPLTVALETQDYLTLDIKEIVEQYKKIAYAISKDGARPMLQTVCFRKNNMITTDGWKAAIVPVSQNFEKDLVLRDKTMKNIGLVGDSAELCIETKDDGGRYQFFEDLHLSDHQVD